MILNKIFVKLNIHQIIIMMIFIMIISDIFVERNKILGLGILIVQKTLKYFCVGSTFRALSRTAPSGLCFYVGVT